MGWFFLNCRVSPQSLMKSPIGTYFEAAHILGVLLFDPDSDRMAVIASRTAKVESLLPKRIRRRETRFDDDF